MLVALTVGTCLAVLGASAQDTVPPAITGIKVVTVGEFSFEVYWETNEPSVGGVEWGTSKDYGGSKDVFTGYSTKHYLNITGLERDTLYHFRIYAEDLEGNTARSGDFTVGTFPYEEDGGGVSGLTLVAIVIAVGVFTAYLFFRRPGGA